LGNTIGDTLRELRVAKGKSIAEVANEIGITPSALANYENNIRVPRDTIKIAIADYYKKPIQKIFFAKKTHET
jgi:transcriptional regulator with XRE-family HTH domain